MPQFDVYELRQEPQLVVTVQSDLVSGELESRLIIPLFSSTDAPWPFTRLTPRLGFAGATWVLGTPVMIGMPKAEMKGPVGSMAEHEYEIMNAIDFLLTGV